MSWSKRVNEPGNWALKVNVWYIKNNSPQIASDQVLITRKRNRWYRTADETQQLTVLVDNEHCSKFDNSYESGTMFYTLSTNEFIEETECNYLKISIFLTKWQWDTSADRNQY